MRFTEWFKSGAPWVWLSAGAVAASLFAVVSLLLLLIYQGSALFWPRPVLDVQSPSENVRLIGEQRQSEVVPAERLRSLGQKVPPGQEMVERRLLRVGNRDLLGSDFRWVLADDLAKAVYPADLAVFERREWGNFYGYPRQVKENGEIKAQGDALWVELEQRLARVAELYQQIRTIEKDDIGAVNYGLEKLRLESRKLELAQDDDPLKQQDIQARRRALQSQYEGMQQRLNDLYQQIRRDSVAMETSSGGLVDVPLSKVVRAYRPNAMSLLDKLGFYLGKIWEFVSDEPREANTEGGIFPAIFGTVMMVFIMTIMITPFGVVAAVYLREYAKQGFLTRLIRIAVNNLAGVPSIVYGVFGLGFFVYFLGGSIDALFYPEALPAPTYGTPGLLWASLTLAILTVPVVIVSTEEGLTRIPRMIREGSLALGATKAETLWRTVLPMASPAIMTGLILAIARAAGEVAPLMLVGVVKLAPTLPLDANAPFLHLDRKFMHLGFHIYDVGFQSPNVEAARPLVYATALLLVLVILVLNLVAIAIRNRLRERYRAEES
ncbi:MAG: phosphate ABC transporter permease PstA [Methylococcaceae bacterium]|nr:MAG: phosphate ABC transporter permease PstA [Methylococcaceae bacterium]